MYPTVVILTTLLVLKLLEATDELNVQCHGKNNITINAPNANFSSVWLENCTDCTAKTKNATRVFLHIKSQDVENITVVVTLSEFKENKVKNTTLAIACSSSTKMNVYRIADGSEFTSKSMRFEVGDIDMRFKTGLEPYSEDLSKVFLGDQFYMILQYIGKSNYYIIPRRCVAYRGNIASSSQQSVEIWNEASCVVSVGIEVMENFSYTKDGRLYAKMYGFRFDDEKHNDITIKCDLKLCLPSNSGNSACGMHICKTTRSLVNMKRIASKNIEIIDDSEKNAACRITKDHIVVIVTELVIMTALRYG